MKKNQLKKDLLKIAPEILKFSQPVWLKIDEFKKQKKKILFEGAQGILLMLIMALILLLHLPILLHQVQQLEQVVGQIL